MKNFILILIFATLVLGQGCKKNEACTIHTFIPVSEQYRASCSCYVLIADTVAVHQYTECVQGEIYSDDQGRITSCTPSLPGGNYNWYLLK
jgi:hypothetical protein